MKQERHEKQDKSDKKVVAGSSSASLDVALAEIEKKFGKGTVMVLGQQSKIAVKTVTTGSILIDRALGVGGLPRGRVVEIFGPEASGKTTIALHAIAQVQKTGGVCAFVDAEHALDPVYAKSVGVNVDNLLISQPDYGEQALDIVEMLVRSGAVDMIVVDSVAALVPRAEIDGEMGDSHMGLQARLMSQAMRKLTPVVSKSKSILVFINQIRQKIQTVMFGNNETTTGGNALKFYSSIRIDVRRIEAIKRGDKHVGNRLIVKIVKNKVAPPFKKVEVDLIFGEGISRERELVDLALEGGFLKQAGAWFSYNGNKLAQGKEALIEKIKSDESLCQELLEKVKLETVGVAEIQMEEEQDIEQQD